MPRVNGLHWPQTVKKQSRHWAGVGLRSLLVVLLTAAALAAQTPQDSASNAGTSSASLGFDPINPDSLQLTPRAVEINLLRIDVGWNGWRSTQQGFNLSGPLQPLSLRQARSFFLELTAFPTRLTLEPGRHLYLYTGLGFQFFNYHFEENVRLTPDSSAFAFTTEPVDFNQNKLSIIAFRLPLLIGYSSNRQRPHRGFRVRGGVFGSVRLASKTKQKSDERGKVKEKGDFHLRRYQAGLTARIGYKYFEFFAQYHITPLFQDGRGAPRLHAFTIGMRLCPL